MLKVQYLETSLSITKEGRIPVEHCPQNWHNILVGAMMPIIAEKAMCCLPAAHGPFYEHAVYFFCFVSIQLIVYQANIILSRAVFKRHGFYRIENIFCL